MALSPSTNIKLCAMKRCFWFDIFAILILFAWLLGQLSLLGWISDLASHFQVQYFLAFILLLVFTLKLRKWYWLPFVLLGFVFTYLAIAPYLSFTVHQQSQGRHHVLRIMQANVLFKNHAYSRVIQTVQKYDPDILSIQEVDPTCLSALKPVLKRYPYHIERVKRGRIYGIALYSKLPLRNASIHYYPYVGRPNCLLTYNGRGKQSR